MSNPHTEYQRTPVMSRQSLFSTAKLARDKIRYRRSNQKRQLSDKKLYNFFFFSKFNHSKSKQPCLIVQLLFTYLLFNYSTIITNQKYPFIKLQTNSLEEGRKGNRKASSCLPFVTRVKLSAAWLLSTSPFAIVISTRVDNRRRSKYPII